MAKKGMNIRYKSRKRERNKYNPESDYNDPVKKFGLTLLSVGLFLGLMALMVLGMEKLGVFQRGYTAPDKDETEISYEYIPIGTVFNRSDKEYYVLFDNYDTVLTQNVYVNTLVDSLDVPVYKVDMSKSENAKYSKEESNKKATKVSELSIKGVTLVKISNGRLAGYYEGANEIEGHLVK